MKRKQKASRIFPRPLRKLRPYVHKPTQRYSGQLRLGRGFTLEEVRQSGLQIDFARTIGIAIDHRRTNKSAELMQKNVDRLKEYIEKLVLLPRREGQPKKGTCGVLSDSTAKTELVQNTDKKVLKVRDSFAREKPQKITQDMNEFRAYGQIRMERMNKKWAGKRSMRENEKKKDTI